MQKMIASVARRYTVPRVKRVLAAILHVDGTSYGEDEVFAYSVTEFFLGVCDLDNGTGEGFIAALRRFSQCFRYEDMTQKIFKKKKNLGFSRLV